MLVSVRVLVLGFFWRSILTPLFASPFVFTDSSTTGQPISASSSSPTSDVSANATVESPQYDLPHKEHAPHPNCPDTLACLPDTDGRPQHTLPVILRCAILGSARRRLTIREIYAAMEEKYLYFRTAGPTWKVSALARV